MSRGLSFVLGLVAGLAVAAGVGALTSLDESDPPFAPGVSPAPVTEPRPDAPERRGVDRPRRSASDPFAAIDVGELSAPPPAAGRITGRVVDADGRAAAGVKVRATPRAGPPDVREPPTFDAEEQLRRDLRDVVRRHRFDSAWRREAVTDAAGAFVIEGLAERSWRLRASLDGFDVVRSDGQDDSTSVKVGGHVAFTAHRCLEVEFAVVRPDGTSPERALIEISGGDEDDKYFTWSPDAPRVRLRAGKWTAVARAGEDDEWMSRGVVVEADEKGTRAPVRLDLVERPGVIVVLGPAGEQGPIAAEVALIPDAVASRTAEGDDSDEAKREWIAPGERAEFLDLAPGRWTLVVANGTGVEFHRATIDVGAGVVRLEVPLPPRDLRDWVFARVLDPEGAPVLDVRFDGGYVSPTGSVHGAVKAVRLEDGRWRVPAYPGGRSGGSSSYGEPEPAKATRRWISVESDEWGTAHADVDPAAGTDVVLRFETPARLAVKVEGAAPGGPELVVEVADLSQQNEPPFLDQFFQRRNVEGGVVSIGPLPARRARVELSTASGDDESPLAVADVALVAGENRVTLVAPVFQSLRVAVPEGTEPDRTSLQRFAPDGSRPWLRREATTERTATWIALPPGSYRLWCSAGDMPLTIPCPAEIRFVPRPFTAVRFTAEPDSAEHAAGLRTGDVCFALDGAEFEGMKQIDAVFYAARVKQKSRLTLLRGTSRVELEIDLSKFDLRWDYMSR
jgi:hypothetical protein